MNLKKIHAYSPMLELNLAESACLLQLINQILIEAKQSKYLDTPVNIFVDSPTQIHLLNLAGLLGQLIDFQIEDD